MREKPKKGLPVHETGRLLQETEVRGMLREGDLRSMAAGGKIDPESVWRRLADSVDEHWLRVRV